MNVSEPAVSKSIGYEQLFEENGYVILKRFVPLIMCDYISENIKVLEASSYFDYGDTQVEKAFSAAAPAITETLLDVMTPILSQAINLRDCIQPIRICESMLQARSLRSIRTASCEIKLQRCRSARFTTIWPLYIEAGQQGNRGRT